MVFHNYYLKPSPQRAQIPKSIPTLVRAQTLCLIPICSNSGLCKLFPHQYAQSNQHLFTQAVIKVAAVLAKVRVLKPRSGQWGKK